jgi:hypothetical protein
MTNDELVIPELHLQIPFEKAHNVQSLSLEKLETLGLLHAGLLASALKKKKVYMVLTFDDDAAVEQNPVFEVEKIEEIQSILYHRIMKHE